MCAKPTVALTRAPACALAVTPATDAGASPESLAASFHTFRQTGVAPALASAAPTVSAAVSAAAAPSLEAIQKSMRLLLLVRAYQVRRASPSLRSLAKRAQHRRYLDRRHQRATLCFASHTHPHTHR